MGKASPPEVPVRFYSTGTGKEPVREWLRCLAEDDRHAVGLDLMRVQFGWPIGMPLVRSLKDGLWEVRSSLPSQWLALAKRRMKEVTTRRRKTVILAHRWMSS